MRIISKFHDYYDSLMGHGQDQSCLYLRKTKEYDLEKDKNAPSIIKDVRAVIDKHSMPDTDRGWFRSGLSLSRVDTIRTKSTEYTWGQFNILFCGKLYKGISIERRGRNPETYHAGEISYFYSADSVRAYMVKHGIDNQTIDNWTRRAIRKPIPIIKTVEKYFSDVIQPDINWMIANKVICVMQKDNIITVNPCLRDIHFFKRFEPYAAFQELDMWVSGTLAYPQNEMVEISDKHKVLQHGFDEKYGFRTRPEKSARA